MPNLTVDEVRQMFQWYEAESGQRIDAAVVDRIFYETQGQPGLTCWLGELLTETYNLEKDQPLKIDKFEEVCAAALKILPHSNILNIISKARQDPYQKFILTLFESGQPISFAYDRPIINYLYLNGVIDLAQTSPVDYVAA